MTCSRCGRRPAEHRSSDDALAAVSDEHQGTCADCLTALQRQPFIDAVRAQAWEIRQEGWDMDMNPVPDDAGRRLVHCRLGGIGADWDEHKVVDLIERADDVGWCDNWMGHDLCVVHTEALFGDPPRKRAYFFQVRKPAEVES